MAKARKREALLTDEELYELAHSALNDVEYGEPSDKYVKRIRRIAEKALGRIYERRKVKTDVKK